MSVVNQRSQHKSITNSQVFFVTTFVCYFLLVKRPLCLLGTLPLRPRTTVPSNSRADACGAARRRRRCPTASLFTTTPWHRLVPRLPDVRFLFFWGLKHIETMKMLRDA
jgi:hypothetical protein